jgi:hypothetical protein
MPEKERKLGAFCSVKTQNSSSVAALLYSQNAFV